MKIFTAGWNPDKIGGGHSWLRNFRKCFADQIVDDPKECDIYLIPSLSMIEKLSLIPLDKKIVLRVDNALMASRNRNIYPFSGDKVTMMEALRFVAQKADLVIYQTTWCKQYLDDFLKPKKSTIIMNSVDESIFNRNGTGIPTDKEVYLYTRSSRSDNKGWHVAYYEYQMIQRKNPNAELWIVGQFSPTNNEHNFDFFQGENYRFLGFTDDPEVMATHYRTAKHLLFTFFNDACSNSLVEALLCGTNIIYYELSGGTKQIKEMHERYGDKYFHLERMSNEYKKALENL